MSKNIRSKVETDSRNPGRNPRDRFDPTEVDCYDVMFGKLERELGITQRCEYVDLGQPEEVELSDSDVAELLAAAEKIIKLGGVHIVDGVFLYRGKPAELKKQRAEIRKIIARLPIIEGLGGYGIKRRLEANYKYLFDD
jgi:hypothetical protein